MTSSFLCLRKQATSTSLHYTIRTGHDFEFCKALLVFTPTFVLSLSLFLWFVGALTPPSVPVTVTLNSHIY